MITRTAILALSLAFAGTPAVAAADEGSAIVRTGDLDLTTAAGRQTLDQRVKNAAQRLCRSGGRGLTERSLELECVEQVIAGNQPKTDRAIAEARGESRLALLMVRAAR